MNYEQLNGLSLAYVGDAVYEVAVRDYLINQGQTKPQVLHRKATHYVSAKAQAALLKEMLASDFLTEQEKDIFKRGRNSKSYTSAKNTDIQTYRISTGFEALIGYLHLTKQTERLDEILTWCLTHGGES